LDDKYYQQISQSRGIYIFSYRDIYREFREFAYYYQNCIIGFGITFFHIRR
jgi:hypothetical protein